MTLINIIEYFIPGDWGNETLSEEAPCKVSCIRGADIVPIENNDFSHIPTRYISQQSFDTKCLQAGDIIVEKSGGSPTQSTGRVSYVSQELIDSVGNVVCSNFCVAFRVKQNWNPLYIYYYLQHVYNNGVFFNFEGKTSGIKNLHLEAAYNAVPIEDVNKATQDSVVTVLDSIKKKITINRAINQNLEALAKQLYDYWFVQFDFPNEEGKPYKSSGGAMVWNDKLKREIPKGWSVEAIGSILDKYPTTKRYETKEYLSQGKYPIVDQGDAYIVGFTNEDDNLLTRHPAVLFGDHSTKVKLLDFAFARGADGTQILYSNNPNISQYYLYMVVLSLQIPNPGYSRHFKYLKELPIIIPDKRIMDAFTITVSLMFKQRKENIFSNITLSKQRDELLPLLMNGQVSLNSDLSIYYTFFKRYIGVATISHYDYA